MVGVLQDWGKERLHYRGEHTTLDLSAQVVTPLEPEPDLSAGLGGSPGEVVIGGGVQLQLSLET